MNVPSKAPIKIKSTGKIPAPKSIKIGPGQAPTNAQPNPKSNPPTQ